MKTIKLTEEAWALLNNYKCSNSKKNYSETILMLDNFIEKSATCKNVYINKFNPKNNLRTELGEIKNDKSKK